MHIPIAVLVLIVFALVAAAGVILLLLCGGTNRFIGFSVAFEAIADDYTKCKVELKKSNETLAKATDLSMQFQNETFKLQQQIRDLQEEIKQVKQQKKYLTRQYVDMSNEYAWFRSLIRESDPEQFARANATIAAKRKVDTLVGANCGSPVSTPSTPSIESTPSGTAEAI